MLISQSKSLQTLTKLSGHLQASQPGSKRPCQYSEGVSYAFSNRSSGFLKHSRMLYEFHRQQNGKKPDTIHATYLLSGTKRKEESIPRNGEVKKDGEDDYMQSSPFVGSSMPQLDEGTGESSVLSITLVKEEDLDGMCARFDTRTIAERNHRSAGTIRAYQLNTHL
jgi:hypothetical protein